MPILPGMNAEMTDFWQQQSALPHTIHDLPGDHFSCLNARHIDIVLKALNLQQEEIQHG
ncbi:hypothetical protein SC206_12110 [Rouxiella sp. T17]|uniref:hypothetical protein n=1 Tax=Rouxiella sp. T17 TaxID=3085684 RepID=UPI002FC894A2